MEPDRGHPEGTFTPESDFQITVPADASSLFYIRLFAGAVARAVEPVDAGDSVLYELKLLLTEATGFALSDDRAADDTVSVSFRVAGGRLECRIRPVPTFGPTGLIPDPYDVVMTLASQAELMGEELLLVMQVG